MSNNAKLLFMLEDCNIEYTAFCCYSFWSNTNAIFCFIFITFLCRHVVILVYLHMAIRISALKKKKFWHSFQMSLNYSRKDFLFRTWPENRLQRASIFPLAGNPKISFTTLKTFCLQSIRCHSHSHKSHDNNCQLSAFQLAETYWCKDRSGSTSLMWLSLSQQYNPQVKVNFKSCSRQKIFQLC